MGESLHLKFFAFEILERLFSLAATSGFYRFLASELQWCYLGRLYVERQENAALPSS